MNESEIDLYNLPLAEALSFADEGSTTGGLLTHAALKTLAAGCRELTAARAEITTVTAQRDRLAEALARTRNMIQTHPEAAESCATEALQSLTTNEL
jgi:hypothetical protein